MSVPKAFLRRPFEDGVLPVIATGFKFRSPEIALHGVTDHEAIDFDVPRGTPVLAAAGGWALCSYGEAQRFDSDGTPRMLGRRTILANTPADARGNLHLPDTNGPWPIWYGSYVVQILHDNGCYTQYAHLDWVPEEIPYHPPYSMPPVKSADHTVYTGGLHHSRCLRLPIRQYRPPVAVRVAAGQQIGVAGMTGSGISQPCWDFATIDQSDGRPDFRGRSYYHYNNPNLHLMVFGARETAKARKPIQMFDPFGQYREIEDYAGVSNYPNSVNQWAYWNRYSPHSPSHHSLWLP